MSAFHKITLDFNENSFDIFQHSANFVPTGKGRWGNHLVNKVDKGIPIVRTTTNYDIPANYFTHEHLQLIHSIQTAIQHSQLNDIFGFNALNEENALNFNNALIEIYDKSYRKMKYHSDQCLDIADNSMIAIFSCYENPSELDDFFTRHLKIIDRDTGKVGSIALTHNSVVFFSTKTNAHYNHKLC